MAYVLKCKITIDLHCYWGGLNLQYIHLLIFSTCIKWMPTAMRPRKKLGRGYSNTCGLLYNIKLLRSVPTFIHVYFVLSFCWEVRGTIHDRHRGKHFGYLSIDHLLLSWLFPNCLGILVTSIFIGSLGKLPVCDWESQQHEDSGSLRIISRA